MKKKRKTENVKKYLENMSDKQKKKYKKRQKRCYKNMSDE